MSMGSAVRATVTSPSAAHARRLLDVLGEHRALIAIASAYILAGHVIDAALPHQQLMRLSLYDQVFFVALAVYLALFVIGFAVVGMFRVERDQPLLPTLARRFRHDYLTVERIGGFVIAAVYVRLLGDTFMSLKPAIPIVHPFAWDEAFMRWDHALHLGHHPWELLQPLMGPLATAGINFVYNLWLFVMFGVVFWQAWSRNRRLRTQFFVSFGLAWIVVGTIAATGLSSAGPCYFGRVVAGQSDPYTPLMSYLHEVNETHPVWALDVQDALWSAYEPGTASGDLTTSAASDRIVEMSAAGDTSIEGEEPMIKGISAMPSMHVTTSVLFALVAWSSGGLVFAAFALFALAIQVGSVHLGWHYAIDGYLGAALIVAIWLGVGRLLRHGAR